MFAPALRRAVFAPSTQQRADRILCTALRVGTMICTEALEWSFAGGTFADVSLKGAVPKEPSCSLRDSNQENSRSCHGGYRCRQRLNGREPERCGAQIVWVPGFVEVK